MTFKQEYLHKNGPFPFDFHQERTRVLQQILGLIGSFHPNEWGLRAFAPHSFLESFKQVYGITSQQLTGIVNLLLSYLKDPSLSCEANICILKTLCGMKQFKISLDESFKFDNAYFLARLKLFRTHGIPFPLKNADVFMELQIKLIKSYCRFGDEYLDEIVQLSVQEKDIKYLAIFIKSIKSQKSAETILKLIFEESSIFERDTPFFYIICELTSQFPHIDLEPFYETLSQEIIKSIMTVVDPSTQDDLKKLTSEDPYIGVICTIKSIARILVNCLRPMTEPRWVNNWSCIERIFSIIGGLINHSHEVECINDFLLFMKDFVKAFYARYRKENGMFKEVNQDFVEEYTDQPSSCNVIGNEYINMFNQLWMPLIPQLLYLEDGEVQAAKILTDLAIFSPQIHLNRILSQISMYLQKDVTINSIYTPKMVILFLQEFTIIKYAGQHEFSLLIQCCEALLDALEKLGISENLDILELVIRNYMYFSETIMEQPNVESLTTDIISIIEQNLDPMSINLESAEGEQAELYTDFKNIYFNFIIRLNTEQINGLCDKLLYKIKNTVPAHRQAYEFLIICLCYKKPQFAIKILDFVFSQVVHTSPQQSQSQKSASQLGKQALPQYQNYSLGTRNQQNLRWYCCLIQSAFQYHPENVVSQWKKLQPITILLLREFDNTTIFEWGLDIIFNVIINLQNIHLQPKEFYKAQNYSYKTMANVNWQFPTPNCVVLLQTIKSTFFDAISKFMINRYEGVLGNSDRAQKMQSRKLINPVFENGQTPMGPAPTPIKEFVNQILDCILVPSTPTPENIEERKLIHKLLSIQYSVFSALQMRSEYSSSGMEEISGVFIKEMGNIRKQAIPYLKWILALLAHQNCLYDDSMLKLFHFFWREAHDQLYFSAGIQATNDKLNPFFYPILFKKKELFENPFLITTECYVTFMMRIQLFHMLKPMAIQNNPQFLDYLSPLCYSSHIDSSIKSYIPASIPVHSIFHSQIMNLCRYKLSLHNASSYINKYINLTKNPTPLNKIEKEKFLGAIRVIVTNYKRNMSVFMYPCCLRDERSWYALQETLEITQFLEKKIDKVGIIEVIYLVVVFSFDFKAQQIYHANLRNFDRKLETLVGSDADMLAKIINFIKYLLYKINVEFRKKAYEKDATVLVLLLQCYSQFIPIHDKIFSEVIPLAFETTMKPTEDMMNIGKSFLFRIINRFVKKHVKIVEVENTPVKRDFQQFLMYRYVGARTKESSLEPPDNLITNKSENYYYPLRTLSFLTRQPMDASDPIEALLLQKLHDESLMRRLFKALLLDTQLKSKESEVDVSYLSEEEPKRIHSNGHKIINYILDSNPKKLDIYVSFLDNYSSYPICFYHRFFRKMLILGGAPSVQVLQKMAIEFINSPEKDEVKLAQFLVTELLYFCFQNAEFYDFYTNYLVTCSKEDFEFAKSCLDVVFCMDWKVAKKIFNRIIQRLRAEKGPSRLRHFDVFTDYLLCTGRFAQEEAKSGIEYLMGGIEEGTDQVSQLIVSMLIYCFIIPINLQELPPWVSVPVSQLALTKQVYKLNSNTGYSINELVKKIIGQIVSKTSQQKNMQSKNLMIYSKLTNKILSSITVYRFNDEFYGLFKDMMLYLVNKPVEEGGYDEEIVAQFKDSQYPQHIYKDVLAELIKMEGNTINVIKKKLKYIESMVINKIYSSNQVSIPDVFEAMPEKNITMDLVVAVSNMARLMKGSELSAAVVNILDRQDRPLRSLYFMMAYLLAAGARYFDWKQKLLNEILSFKKCKIVKQFVSYWWKGKNPETEYEERLCMLVRSVEIPYSYFA